jgi:hypothetical protein
LELRIPSGLSQSFFIQSYLICVAKEVARRG